MTGFSGKRIAPSATVDVLVEVFDAPPVRCINTTIAPSKLDVLYIFDFVMGVWDFRAKVTGNPVLHNGLFGRSYKSVTFHEDSGDIPPWIAEFVREHMPPSIPDLSEGPA